ncbi:hypothetical protein AAH029_19750 [Parabacteroides distasonis]
MLSKSVLVWLFSSEPFDNRSKIPSFGRLGSPIGSSSEQAVAASSKKR